MKRESVDNCSLSVGKTGHWDTCRDTTFSTSVPKIGPAIIGLNRLFLDFGTLGHLKVHKVLKSLCLRLRRLPATGHRIQSIYENFLKNAGQVSQCPKITFFPFGSLEVQNGVMG